MAFESSLERTVLPPPDPGRGVGKGSTVEGGSVVWVGYDDELGWVGYEAEREKVALPTCEWE